MTATTRTTRAEELRNVALNGYDARLAEIRAAMRHDDPHPLAPFLACLLLVNATEACADAITRADEFEAAGGAA